MGRRGGEEGGVGTDKRRAEGGRADRGPSKAADSWDVPFELVCEVASAGAVAEARNVERGAAAARHGGCVARVLEDWVQTTGRNGARRRRARTNPSGANNVRAKEPGWDTDNLDTLRN